MENTTHTEEIYRVIPWRRNAETVVYALVDTIHYAEVSGMANEEECVIAFGFDTSALDEGAARLNKRIKDAAEAAPEYNQYAYALALTPEVAHMLTRISESLKETIDKDPIIGTLRKFTSAIEEAHGVENELESKIYESTSKEFIVSKIIRDMYTSGVSAGAVKP